LFAFGYPCAFCSSLTAVLGAFLLEFCFSLRLIPIRLFLPLHDRISAHSDDHETTNGLFCLYIPQDLDIIIFSPFFFYGVSPKNLSGREAPFLLLLYE